jgi:hypothetical protein
MLLPRHFIEVVRNFDESGDLADLVEVMAERLNL